MDDGEQQGNSVMVRNMPFSTTEDYLWETFGKYGTVERIKVPLGEDGRPRGFAFIDYASPENASAALELDGAEWDGRNVVVQIARPREPRQERAPRGGQQGGGQQGGRGNWVARNQHLAGQTPLLFFGGVSYNRLEDSLPLSIIFNRSFSFLAARRTLFGMPLETTTLKLCALPLIATLAVRADSPMSSLAATTRPRRVSWWYSGA